MSFEGLTPPDPIEPPVVGEYPTTPYPVEPPVPPQPAVPLAPPEIVVPTAPPVQDPPVGAYPPPAAAYPPPAAAYPPPAAAYPPPAAAYPPPAAAYPPPSTPPGYASAPAQFPKTSNNAVVALVLAIGSFLICPVILSVAALIVANSAKREIQASQGWVTGDGMVTAAKVISWINIALTIVVVVVVIIVAALGLATQSGTSVGA